MALEDMVEESIEESIESEANAPKEKTKTANWETGGDRIRAEMRAFKDSGKGGRIERVLAGPIADSLILFCKNERFSEAVRISAGTFEGCLKKIAEGVGSAISDLEAYQRAAAYYFPDAKISFSMNIDVDGLEMPVQSKKVVATMPEEKTKLEAVKPVEPQPAKQETKRITVDLSEFF